MNLLFYRYSHPLQHNSTFPTFISFVDTTHPSLAVATFPFRKPIGPHFSFCWNRSFPLSSATAPSSEGFFKHDILTRCCFSGVVPHLLGPRTIFLSRSESSSPAETTVLSFFFFDLGRGIPFFIMAAPLLPSVSWCFSPFLLSTGGTYHAGPFFPERSSTPFSS